MARTPALVVVAAAEAAEDRMGAPVALAAVQAAAAWMRVLGEVAVAQTLVVGAERAVRLEAQRAQLSQAGRAGE